MKWIGNYGKNLKGLRFLLKKIVNQKRMLSKEWEKLHFSKLTLWNKFRRYSYTFFFYYAQGFPSFHDVETVNQSVRLNSVASTM